MTLRLFIYLVVSTGLAAVDAIRCPAQETQVPKKVNYASTPEDYQLVEAALQIYTHLRIPCDGWLDQWRFMVGPNQIVSGLHLGIFRPRTPGVFEVIGRSHFIVFPTPSDTNWISYHVKHKISVRRGDCLGIWYDKFETPVHQLTIRSRMLQRKHDIAKRFPTYVLALDETDLSLNRTIDVHWAPKDFRNPALSAVISSIPPASLSKNIKKQYEISAPEEYLPPVELALYKKHLQEAAQSHDPPPNDLEPYLTEPVDYPDSMEDLPENKCNQPSKVPEKFKKLPANRYQFAETSLQIFSSLKIECDGYLSSWHFLATEPIIDGVHLGVFREHSSRTPHLLTLIDETHVVNMTPPTQRARGFWVTYLPPKPLSVKAGDYIGLYYSDYRVPRKKAAILSKGEEDFEPTDPKTMPTYVLLTDGQSLGVNDTIDIRFAAKTLRLPALSATIEPLGYIKYNT